MSNKLSTSLRQHPHRSLILKVGVVFLVLIGLTTLFIEEEIISDRKPVAMDMDKVLKEEDAAIAATKTEDVDEIAATEAFDLDDNTPNTPQYVYTIKGGLKEAKAPTAATEPVDEDAPRYGYTIQEGDNLSSILARFNVPYTEVMSIMDTDQNNLTLDTLNPGDTLKLWIDEKDEHLTKFEVQFSPANKVVFTRNDDDGSYNFDEINLPSQWKDVPLMGPIHGSFSMSAFKQGISSAESAQITQILKHKLNFNKLRAGDKFEIMQKREFVGEEFTGNREIEAIRIYTNGKVISAYLHSDGQYYDRNGNSLQRAFMRWPTRKQYRISSRFNPNRLHPVTHRLSPHNGEDIACPSGTDVLATADGVVTMVTNHPYAGKYVVIKHSSTYSTRYLHLSKFLVRQGQAVRRGDVIAKSGATGRVTGPHLHYEFLIRNKPVSFLTAKMPMATSVPHKEKATFLANVKRMDSEFTARKIALEKGKQDQLAKQKETLKPTS
ncbi:MAG: peptidoglycan DD-metalloendopeptidase family protein [Vibrio sp.]